MLAYSPVVLAPIEVSQFHITPLNIRIWIIKKQISSN